MLIYILLKNSVSISKKTQYVSITNINWIMLFSKITAIYSQNYMKPINMFCGQNTVRWCIHLLLSFGRSNGDSI